MDFTKAPLNHGKSINFSHGTVLGRPVFGQYNPFYFQKENEYRMRNALAKMDHHLPVPGEGLKRAMNFYADYGGCGLWRMSWPEFMINGYGKGIVNGLTQMVIDPNFYKGISAVRLQRQATPEQLKFIEFLKLVQQEHGFKIIYEVDDVVFAEDIPHFNKAREAFDKAEIKDSIHKILGLVDEMCVVSPYMRDYYKRKTGKQEISVIPNYAPKFCFLIVNKRTEAKFFEFSNGNTNNPKEGTVIDSQVTTPNMYEFYLQPQFVNSGTATPTHFHCIYDNTGIPLEILEKITYRMCYYYWNWSGAIREPAALKFAEVANKFSSTYLHSEVRDKLKNCPYYI